MARKFRAFANGSEYQYWQSCNCEQCGKATWDEPWDDMAKAGKPFCPIQRALSAASVGSGEVNRRMAARAGLFSKWECQERVHESQWDESITMRSE